jgi:hypothetical protein
MFGMSPSLPSTIKEEDVSFSENLDLVPKDGKFRGVYSL